MSLENKLDGLGIYNALHEYATTNGNYTRYDNGTGPMGYWTKNKTAELKDFSVEVVDYSSDADAYGRGIGHTMGWEGRCHLVFKITPDESSPPAFYKLEGGVDSYVGEHWDGKFLPVTPRIENVTVYQWEN